MSKPIMVRLLVLVSLLAIPVSPGRLVAAADNIRPDAVPRVTSTESDRVSAEITIYNSGLGLVKDRRNVTLGRGDSVLQLMDVASQVIPSSVSVEAVSEKGTVSVLEQNYEYDLLSPAKLLEKYVGKTVRVRYRNPYTDREDEKEAKVLAYNDGQPVLQVGNEVTFGIPGNYVFPQVPEDLIARPTLSWLLRTDSAGARQLETLYLTNGMTWRADYVLVLEANEKTAGMSAWVTLDNRSGANFRNARLKLVAGDVHRVREDAAGAGRPMPAKSMAMQEAAPQFRESSLFEYHLYTLQRPTDVKNNQSKQVGLLSAQEVTVSKEYVFRGRDHYFRGRLSGYIEKDRKIPVYLIFRNDKASRLGMPLPKGIVRVYKRDQDESLQFVGENNIDHTPVDEKIRMTVGNAFDVVGDRKQTTWNSITSNMTESEYEISLRNHKKEDITIRIEETIPGDWKILESSHPYKKEDSGTAIFQVKVGHPAEQIVQTAKVEKADAIVMGHRSETLLQKWLLGSVAKRVLSYAHCTVFIVR